MHTPLPIQGDNDPRISLYRAQRQEWINHQRNTPRLQELEAQTRELTIRMRESLGLDP